MQAMLAGVFQPTLKYCQRSSVTSPLLTKAFEINLFKISAVAYRLLSRKKNHKTFAASLNKLDSLLAGRQATNQVALATFSEIDYCWNSGMRQFRLLYICLSEQQHRTPSAPVHLSAAYI
jgi:hypothetical protein